MMNYIKDLKKQRPHDCDFHLYNDERTGLPFIGTAGHGFLVVPKSSKHAQEARNIRNTLIGGYESDLAFYLEEDCQYTVFLKAIKCEV